MAVDNGIAVPEENTPFLGDQRRQDSDGSSEETLADSQRTGDEESAEGVDDKANQHVGRGRGLLIILSLWGLIFLQGKLRNPY